jgi:pseudaminic acid synthase
MEPKEFQTMVESVRNVEKALGEVSYELSSKARMNRAFSRSLFVVEDVKEGEVITERNVRSIRPGFGLAPKHYQDVVGRKASQDIKKGTPLSFDLLSADVI